MSKVTVSELLITFSMDTTVRYDSNSRAVQVLQFSIEEFGMPVFCSGDFLPSGSDDKGNGERFPLYHYIPGHPFDF